MAVIDWKKWWFKSKRFWTLGVGLFVRILIEAQVIPADSENAMVDELLKFFNWLDMLLLSGGTVLAFRGGPALTFAKANADVTTVVNPPVTVTETAGSR